MATQYFLWIKKKWRKYVLPHFRNVKKETTVLFIFGFFLFVILARLFQLQVVQGAYFAEELLNQHYTKSSLEAERGHVFITDRSGEKIQLTENIEVFDLFVDPKFVVDKENLINQLAPIIQRHLCDLYGLEEPSKYQCLENLEKFTRQDILPQQQHQFYLSGVQDTSFDLGEYSYSEELDAVYEKATPLWIKNTITDLLDSRIQSGPRKENYVGTFVDQPEVLEQLRQLELSYLNDYDGFLYIEPKKISNREKAARELSTILGEYDELFTYEYVFGSLMVEKENRYVKLVGGMNSLLVGELKKLKTDAYDQRLLINNEEIEGEKTLFPKFHSLGFQPSQRRYYPKGDFMSHIVGYVDKEGESFYGVEEYLNDELAGKEGNIIGLATPWIGQVGSNSVMVQDPVDGVDVYLTIDPTIQKELESMTKQRLGFLNADSIAITVMDPHTGKVQAMVNAPTFNPNRYGDSYKLKPLTTDYRFLIEDITRVEIPVFYLSGSDLLQADDEQRNDLTLKKYFFENYLGPQVFVDKNISFPYEPGSIFKSLTLGIGVDSDTFSMYDFYNDPGEVTIGPFTIANISSRCTGTNTYMHALAFSCNVGMVRMAQKILKYPFYNYLKNLGFGAPTGVELSGEDGGTLPDYNSVSKARFFNNTYGQGILATPLQMASAYSALVNGGRYIRPTIIDAKWSKQQNRFIDLASKDKRKVFKDSTSQDIKDALVNVVNYGNLKDEIYRSGLSLGGKTGTSEIAYKGKYKGGRGRTNGSFVGIVTAEDVRYVVAIQVRRPRSSQRGLDTAGRVFSRVSDFLISYDQIED